MGRNPNYKNRPIFFIRNGITNLNFMSTLDKELSYGNLSVIGYNNGNIFHISNILFWHTKRYLFYILHYCDYIIQLRSCQHKLCLFWNNPFQLFQINFSSIANYNTTRIHNLLYGWHPDVITSICLVDVIHFQPNTGPDQTANVYPKC